MRPFQHAFSSAANTGRGWATDLPVHEFLDSTKFCCADRRHRAVLHHVDLGAAICAQAFPERTDINATVAQHLVEDLGQTATLQDWFDHCDRDSLPRPVHRRIADGPSGVAALVAGRLKQPNRELIQSVCTFLFTPMRYLDRQGSDALPLLMNSAGPMIVRRIFGPPAPDPDGQMMDHAWIAEAAIFTAYGRIPDLGEVVRCWKAEPVRTKDESH